jgi:hypothetical protein
MIITKKHILEVVNDMLLPYKITFQDLEDEYYTDKEGIITIDGVRWCDYFYVPQFYQEYVVKKWEQKYKTKFGMNWLNMPNGYKINQADKILYDKSTKLWINRKQLIKVWE